MNNSGFERLQSLAEIPHDFRTISLLEVEPKNEKQKALIEMFQELGRKEFKTLLVCGVPGTGKTFLSMTWLNWLLSLRYKADKESERTIKYITHYELDLKFRSAMTSRERTQADVFKGYSSFEFLVIDEFCRGATSDYSMTFIENLISKRYEWNRPTAILTNKSAAELMKLLDAQMLDRLGNSKQKTFALDGDSLR